MPAYSYPETFTIPDFPNSSRESKSTSAATLALAALGWVLEVPERAQRYMDLTGLDPDTLRQGLDSPTILVSVLDFLANYEPDLIRAAEAMAVTPEDLIAARRELSE